MPGLRVPYGGSWVEVQMLAGEAEGSPGPGLVLTHGAGGNLNDAGLAALAGGLAERGHPVARFNLPFSELGKRPPAAEKSVEAYASAFEQAGTLLAAPPGLLAAGGKSYGGRVASLAVAGGMEVLGLVFYGYPLHAPGRPQDLRVGHWPQIPVPCLFLQGSGDAFCDLGLLRENLGRLAGPVTLRVVEGGDHSLRVSAKASPDGRPHSAPEVMAGLAPEVSAWLAGIERV